MTKKELEVAQEEVVKCRRNGGSLKDCACMAGVDVSTLFRWRENERFAMRLHQARTLYKMTLMAATRQKKPDWLLERQFPKEFGPNPTENEELAQKVMFSDNDLAERLVRLFHPTKSEISLAHDVDGS